MISRRQLRIKSMQIYYSYLQSEGNVNFNTLQRELSESVNQSYQLFISLHCLLISLKDYAEDKMQNARNKHIPTYDELNPNLKFINNSIISHFCNDNMVNNSLSNVDLNWKNSPELIKSLYNKIISSNYYNEFLASPTSGYKEDLKIIKKILQKSVSNNSEIDTVLEDKNIYWNDDLEFWCSMMIQNLELYDSETIADFKISPLYKNAEDEGFSSKLLKLTVLEHNRYDEWITNLLKKWELERIALLDRVILHLAICEFCEFPEIPVRVTLNEYLEIAKFYSSSKSNIFINGILDKIYNKLVEDNKINKSGLGLVNIVSKPSEPAKRKKVQKDTTDNQEQNS